MPSTAGLTNQAKVDFLSGTHNPTTDTYKLALFNDDSNMTPSTTTTYTANGTGAYAGRMQGEHANTGTYSAGGATVTGPYTVTLTGNTAYIDFPAAEGPMWTGATFVNVTTALLYNSSKPGNKAIAIFVFPAVNTISGSFLAKLPDPGLSAIIRFV